MHPDDCTDFRTNPRREASGARRRTAPTAFGMAAFGGAFGPGAPGPDAPDAQPVGGRPVGRDVLAGVEAYWSNRCLGARVPRRSDIDPDGIAAALPAVLMLERVAPGVARIRHAGQQIAAACGMDPRGMPLSVFFAPVARRTLGSLVESAFAGPAIVGVPLTAARGLWRADATGHLLILPLDDGSGDVNRALAVIVTDVSVVRRTPVRFDIPASPPPRIEVIPVPQTLRIAPRTAVRTEPDVMGTVERRMWRQHRDGAYKPFQVLDGDGAAPRDAKDARRRPALSLVVDDS